MAMPLQRPRAVISSFRLRRTSSSVISGDLSKSKPQSVCDVPRSATRVFSWLSRRTAHHQKSALSLDVVCRKALNGRRSKSPSFSERISTGVAMSSTVFGMWLTVARLARARTAACTATELGTIPLESRSCANRSVRTTTSLASAGRCSATAFRIGSSLSRPSFTTATGIGALLAFRMSSAALPSLVDISSSMPLPAPRRATWSMGMMDPRPTTMTKASGETLASALL
mmetsp:Transcript_37683/g.106483  ORF Transcript_37683/g.106483 Transcript_37683/m.106483 type:complete len:228 (+) Transcript_37683:414-1097(+)